VIVALLVGAGCGSAGDAPAGAGGSEPPPEPPAVTTTEATAPPPATAEDSDDGHRPIPAVRFRYFDGSEGSPADFAGTPTVINFWASWCTPCITEMPAFEAVHVELAADVAFLGINVGDEPGAARQLAERTGVTYPLAEDPDSTIFQSFGGIGMPTTVFVDSEGMIVHMISSRLRAQDLRGLISEHLGV